MERYGLGTPAEREARARADRLSLRSPTALIAAAEARVDAGSPDEALTLLDRAAELRPDPSATWHWTRTLALGRRALDRQAAGEDPEPDLTEALAQLATAIEKGFTHRDRLDRSPHLSLLRSHSEYPATVDPLRQAPR